MFNAAAEWWWWWLWPVCRLEGGDWETSGLLPKLPPPPPPPLPLLPPPKRACDWEWWWGWILWALWEWEVITGCWELALPVGPLLLLFWFELLLLLIVLLLLLLLVGDVTLLEAFSFLLDFVLPEFFSVWVACFACWRHLALRFLNQTCFNKKRNKKLYSCRN